LAKAARRSLLQAERRAAVFAIERFPQNNWDSNIGFGIGIDINAEYRNLGGIEDFLTVLREDGILHME